jgi:hypothetical protein
MLDDQVEVRDLFEKMLDRDWAVMAREFDHSSPAPVSMKGHDIVHSERTWSALRVGVVFWKQAEDALSDIRLGATIGGDFVAHTMREAVAGDR